MGNLSHSRIDKNILGNILGKRAIFPTFHVQTLDLGACSFPFTIFNLQSRIFLLLEKETSLEYTIQIDLEEFVSVVHSRLKLR